MPSRAREAAERAVRRSLVWVYALNQSRAKVVMDPIYLAIARRLLKDQPPGQRLMSDRFESDAFFTYRHTSRRLQYFIEDWDWSQARPELLTARQRQMMHTVALGETSGLAVSDGFLRAFRTTPELAAFFGLWFSEELNHFFGYHRYLGKMDESWPAERGLRVARTEVLPYATDPMEVAACNMYQELIGFLIYRSFSRQVKDPFLARMLAQFAKDECRHFRFYQDVVARHIQRHPEFRAVVLKCFLKATSPYNQISGGAANVVDHMTMGAYYFRKPEFEYFLRQNEYLFGKDLRAFWSWYFKRLLEPCQVCAEELVACDCASFEDDAPPPVRNPAWWREAPRRRPPGTSIPVDTWTPAVNGERMPVAGPPV